MNQIAIGDYISQKRREKNLTQAQLAEQLGVSDKTVSKWENGKSMPDYAVIERLCGALGVSVAELLAGCDQHEQGTDPAQMLELIRKTQELEAQKNVIYSLLLVVLGIAMLAASHTIGGSTVRDFLSGAMLGLSVGVMMLGVVLIVVHLVKRP